MQLASSYSKAFCVGPPPAGEGREGWGPRAQALEAHQLPQADATT